MFVICSHCQNEFYTPGEHEGKEINCPKCSKSFQARPKYVQSRHIASLSSGHSGPAGAQQPQPRDFQQPQPRDLSRGFRRLGLVLSIFSGFVCMVIADQAHLGLGDFLDGGRGMDYGPLDDLYMRFVSWVAGFGGVWFIYGIVWYIVRGFVGPQPTDKSKKPPKGS